MQHLVYHRPTVEGSAEGTLETGRPGVVRRCPKAVCRSRLLEPLRHERRRCRPFIFPIAGGRRGGQYGQTGGGGEIDAWLNTTNQLEKESQSLGLGTWGRAPSTLATILLQYCIHAGRHVLRTPSVPYSELPVPLFVGFNVIAKVF